MQTTAWLILLCPLLGCIVVGLGFRVLPARVVGGLGTIAIAAAFVFALNATLHLQDRGEEQRQVVYTAWNYAVTSGVDAKLSILIDPLSMFMALVVTGVSTLIHLYSVAYLAGDRGYARFFSYLNYFVFSMLLLVLGAFAKSAQVPLHTWLPDAMEGPTPVSALIHAATMVTAGVYLIARMHPLFELAPAAADVAGTIGLAVTDLKRVIAYSTMSQIGYMVMGVSAGAYVAGLFHLMTHAFFKALLFMAAGSVISAMGGEQNLDKMGGFRKAMPFTYGCFVIGGLALSGVPPFSGFFSKDEILLVMGEQGGWKWALYVAGYAGAFLTAVYTWRMIFRAFYGEPVPEARELEHGHLYHPEKPFNPATGEEEDPEVGFPGPEHHIAEWALPMKAAMSVLAVLAVIGGIVLIPKTTTWLDDFLEPSFAGSSVVANPSDSLLVIGLILGAALGLAGIFVAYTVWVRRPGTSARWLERFRGLHRLFVNKWYFDELIDLLVVRPALWFGRWAQQTFERIFVEGTLVGGTSGLVRAGSAAVRAAQNGFLRLYAALLLLGVVAVGLYFLIQAA